MALSPYIAAYFGIFAGMIIMSMSARWVYAVNVTVRKYGVNGSPPRLHSGPWMLGIVGYVGYQILVHPHAPSWNWFFGGAAIAPLVAALLTFKVWRRKKIRRAKTNSAT